MSFNQKVTELLKSQHMTKAELAKAAGIPYTTLDSMLKRDSDSARLASVFKIAEHLGVTVEELVFDTAPEDRGIILNDSEKTLINDFRKLDNRGKSTVFNTLSYELTFRAPSERERSRQRALRKIAVYESPAAAGSALPLLSEDYNVIYSDQAPAEASFGIKISGDSMEPEIANGSVAWVKKQETLDTGDIGIFILNGESLCKKLDAGNGKCRLVSLNPKYRPIKILSTDNLRVVGKVLI